MQEDEVCHLNTLLCGNEQRGRTCGSLLHDWAGDGLFPVKVKQHLMCTKVQKFYSWIPFIRSEVLRNNHLQWHLIISEDLRSVFPFPVCLYGPFEVRGRCLFGIQVCGSSPFGSPTTVITNNRECYVQQTSALCFALCSRLHWKEGYIHWHILNMGVGWGRLEDNMYASVHCATLVSCHSGWYP